jgi:hypothetical protein
MKWYNNFVLALAIGTSSCATTPSLVHSPADLERERIERVRQEGLATLGKHRYNGVSGELLERYLIWVEKPTLREVCVTTGLVYFLEVEYLMGLAGSVYEKGKWNAKEEVVGKEFYFKQMYDAKGRLEQLFKSDCSVLQGL